MKKFRNLVATAALAGIIMMGTTSANAGMLLSDFAGGDTPTDNPCTLETKVKVNHGIIVSGVTGIIVSGLGIIVSGFTKDAPTNCGIIVS